MTQNRDRNLGDISDLPLDDGRQRPLRAPAAGEKAAVSSSRGTAKARKPAPAAPTRSGNSNSGAWMMSTAVLAVLVVVLAAFFFRQMSAIQAQLDTQLGESEQKLGNLESQLSATDESSSANAERMQDMLKLHDSEIRKLWGVANDRNKKMIQTNESNIAALKKQRAELVTATESLKKSLVAAETKIDQFSQQRARMQTQVDVLSETVKQYDSRIAEQKKLLEQWQALMPQLKSLASAQKQGDLSSRIAEVEAAVAAFDTWRPQVNGRLDQLEVPR